MRLVTWNTNQRTDLRVSRAFRELQPDVLVAPETSKNPSIKYPGKLLELPHEWKSVPSSAPTKGLSIFGGPDVKISRSHEGVSSAPTALTVDVIKGQSRFHVIGVWTQPSPVKSFHGNYFESFAGIIHDHKDIIGRGTTIVAGDFNVSHVLSPRDFDSYFARLRSDFGLVSAYHSFTGRAFGDELSEDMTYWKRSGLELKGYHIDYVLLPHTWTIEGVAIGRQGEWTGTNRPDTSDHAPVIVDFSIS